MPNAERKPTFMQRIIKASKAEKLTPISKFLDVMGVAYGLIIGGASGAALIFLSASTFYAAKWIEKEVQSAD